MRFRRLIPTLLILCTFPFLVAETQENGSPKPFSIDKAKTRVFAKDGFLTVSLAVVNASPKKEKVSISLDLIDSDDRSVCPAVEKEVVLAPGSQSVEIPVGLRVSEETCDRLDWLPFLRMRYALLSIPLEGSSEFHWGGIFSISSVAPDIFDLSVSALDWGLRGSTLPIQVYAIHPASSLPVKGVQIEAVLHPDGENDRSPIVLTGVTDADGVCPLALNIPADLRESEQSLTIRGKGSLLCRTVDVDFWAFLGFPYISLTTDKPIYQPGQTLYFRSMVFDTDKRAMEGVPVAFTLADEEGRTVFKTAASTSAFGISSGSWPIPDGAPVGYYTLSAAIKENGFQNEYDSPREQLGIEISRYELPTFRADVKPDKAYYLPGQEASLEVTVRTLAREPIAGAAVEVFDNPGWYSYRSRHGEDTEKHSLWKGHTDAEGKCRGELDLTPFHKELTDWKWSQFNDVRFVARVTDPATGRISSAPFALRVSREDIHVYLIEDDQFPGLPIRFYVSTFLADGSPLPCRVEIWGAASSDRWDKEWAVPESPIFVTDAQTNGFGVARVFAPPLSRKDESIDLYATATDEAGRKGHGRGYLYFASGPGLRVEAERIFLRPGDPVTARITSALRDSPVIVMASLNRRPVHSITVRLENGEARVAIPYASVFQGEIVLTAYPDIALYPDKDFDDYARIGQATVLYPGAMPIKAELSIRPETARPGDPVEAEVQVSSEDGSSSQAALGLSVLDTAVEELLREEDDYGRTESWFIRNSIPYGFRDRDELAGYTPQSLARLDRDHIPEGLDVVAEILFPRDELVRIAGTSLYKQAGKLFPGVMQKQLASIIAAVDDYAREHEYRYPDNEAAFREIVKNVHPPLEDLVDPWGERYRVDFSIQQNQDCFKIISPGPDQKAGTPDDIVACSRCWEYFQPYKAPLAAFVQHHLRDALPWSRDPSLFLRQLQESGFPWESLSDPWGNRYDAEVSVTANTLRILVKSPGPNGILDKGYGPENDDVIVWDDFTDKFAPVRGRITTALAKYYGTGPVVPISQEELFRILEGNGISGEGLTDFYGHPYLFVFKPSPPVSARGSEASGDNPGLDALEVWSAGPDGVNKTDDDVLVSIISRGEITTQIYNLGLYPREIKEKLGKEAGAIKGNVTDETGAPLPGLTVTAEQLKTGRHYTATTDVSGAFLFKVLPVGEYVLVFAMPGFSERKVNVSVRASLTVTITVTLAAGAGETVAVTAEKPAIDTKRTGATEAESGPGMPPKRISTPRLRKEFPETLLWIPELPTDADGKARFDFKLADNITRWKLMLVASTRDGKIATADKGITAGLPFFVELELPPILTVGDELQLPAIVRNFTKTSRDVSLRMEADQAFSLREPNVKDVHAEAGSFAREIFAVRAEESREEAAVRIVGTSAGEGDALEKTARLVPYAEEHFSTAGALLSESGLLEPVVPEKALVDGLQAKLTLYPDLDEQIAESLEGILRRPTGCAEQITSAAYANLLYLRLLKSRGKNGGETEARARRALEEGVKKLKALQKPDGGFGFWAESEPDLLLTAYVFRFLAEAGDFAQVEPGMLYRAGQSIVRAQYRDGRWSAKRWTPYPDAETTAYIAAALAKVLKNAGQLHFETGAVGKALGRAMDTLRRRVKKGTCRDAYALACYAIAAHHAEREEDLRLALERLEKRVQAEGAGSFWENDVRTPFWGWGLAGRLETTALTVQAFSLAQQHPGIEKDSYRELARRGTLFLVDHKDHYQVWYSTQATALVLETLSSCLRQAGSGSGGPVEVFVNGSRATSVDVPAAGESTGPISVDLTPFVGKGKNRVELRAGGQLGDAAAYLTTRYYTPWQETETTSRLFQVDFDKREPKVGETVTCGVEVVRPSGRSFGMTIAEIGLPPGAEVDRQSLEAARRGSNWTIGSYDVLPDRVIFYLWAWREDISFRFAFRPRIGGKMVASPSVLYDYYNPDARTTVVPQQFRIQGEPRRDQSSTN